jgi:hypothetical protein
MDGDGAGVGLIFQLFTCSIHKLAVFEARVASCSMIIVFFGGGIASCFDLFLPNS